MTTVDGSTTALAQLQSLLALQTVLSSGSAASATGGSSFAGVLQTLESQLTSGTASGAGATGAGVVADAQKYLGVPYVLGGTTTSGMDCSGLVQTVYKDLGVDMPRDLSKQATMGTPVDSLADAQPGDLIVFKGGGHIGIYAGDGKVIHAPYPGRTVSEQQLWTDDSGIETIRRVVPTGDASALGVLGSGTSAADPASAIQTAFLLGMSLGGYSGASGALGSGLGSGTSGLSSLAGVDPALLAQLITAQSALAAQGTSGSDS